MLCTFTMQHPSFWISRGQFKFMSVHHFQVHPEGKFVVDVDKNIDINDVSIIKAESICNIYCKVWWS